MNAQELTEQIVDKIVQGSFSLPPQLQKSGKTVSPRVSELMLLSRKKKIHPIVMSEEALDKAMKNSIKKYQDREFLLPQLIVRAKFIGGLRDILAGYAEDASALSVGRAFLTTICGRDHTRWRHHVSSILRGFGFNTTDLGGDNSVDDVIHAMKNNMPDILCMARPARSQNMGTNAMYAMSLIPELKNMTDRLLKEGYRKNVTIITGGYVAGIESVEETGVDYCCDNMFQLIELLTALRDTYK